MKTKTKKPTTAAFPAKAIANYDKAIDKIEPIFRTKGSDIYLNVAPGNISVRDEFSRSDYEAFRMNERIPKTPQESMEVCNKFYYECGIVRNIVDLFGDFTVQGIKIQHENAEIEAWHEEWWRRVGGRNFSERFANYLYRLANVPIKRMTARMYAKDINNFRKAVGMPDIEIPDDQKIYKKEIPWQYIVYNPCTIELTVEDVAQFLGSDYYSFAIKIPQQVINKIKKQKKTLAEQAAIDNIPQDIVDMVKNGERTIPLDPDKFKCYYYKKDDWKPWAFPMVHSVLKDLFILEKMKLADVAALDGAINSIRIWKLGNIDAKIMPNEAKILKLAEVLANNVGGGVMDMIWGPDIDLLETSTNVHQFLGDAKYASTLTAIYAGLGVPPTLTGAATQSGYTNNYISLKTLTERLEYGRSILRTFWEGELRIVQKAMGFETPAKLTFSRMTLSDDAAEKTLLCNLADRELISWETLIERFGEDPEIEAERLNSERKKRDKKKLPPKAGPFHTAEQDFHKEKIFATQGLVAPSQVGLDLPAKKGDEKTLLEINAETQQKAAKQAAKQREKAKPGVSGMGRPKSKKDSGKRKQKVVKPRSRARFITNLAVANKQYESIESIMLPFYLQAKAKKNLRQLSTAEAQEFEDLKFAVLCQYQLEDEVTAENIKEVLTRGCCSPAHCVDLFQKTISKYYEAHEEMPNVDIMRRFQTSVYALYRGDYDEEEENENV